MFCTSPSILEKQLTAKFNMCECFEITLLIQECFKISKMSLKSTVFFFSGQFCVLYVVLSSSGYSVSTRPSSKSRFNNCKESCRTYLGYCVILVLLWMVRIFSLKLFSTFAICVGFCLYQVKWLIFNDVFFERAGVFFLFRLLH